MKVLVVNNAAPFIRGGAEELADHLVRALNATPGVESELLRLPFKWAPSERLIEEVLLHRGLRLVNVDRVIALKFPAYLVPHPHKRLWLLHQFRQAYDLGEVGQGLSDEGRDGEIKRIIRAADQACFAECEKIFVNSPTTLERLRRFNRVEADVLYPPLNDADLFQAGAHGDYVFAGGRVAPGKRQHLLIEAFAQLNTRRLRLVIAGPPESEAYADQLRGLVAHHGLEDQVGLHFGFHPRPAIAEWVNGAAACAYIPYDEDSLGYVTMEAFAAGKAVVTTDDSGGLLEMVTHETGVVTAPDGHSLAAAFDQLARDPNHTRALGAAAKSAWDRRGLTWSDTVEKLLS
ncbi:glycosyltransferase family 4 protein [Phenylobacterium sp.]|uniref:glycosyltransferase family 4 protein n=1 Tax=Phenylobacterium sp. TaxID=1871053 RepID=UPI0035C7F6D5